MLALTSVSSSTAVICFLVYSFAFKLDPYAIFFIWECTTTIGIALQRKASLYYFHQSDSGKEEW